MGLTVPPEVLKDIVENQPAYEDRVKALFLTDDEFEKLRDPYFDLAAYRLQKNDGINEIYRNINEILREYCDLREDYYDIITLWIIGTYFHEHFPSYPYLFLNAMRGSGKTRLLKLITYLAKDGCMLNSLTEAVMFRTKGTLAIDEFEGITRKGAENLTELLNSAYKKGTKVKRMRKTFGKEGEKHEPEEFDVYRPILLANISGMESVLGDRCITLILEKSSRSEITNLIELFEYDEKIKRTKELLTKITTKNEKNDGSGVSLVSMSFLLGVYRGWNDYIRTNYTNNTIYTNNTNDSNNINNIFPYKTIQDAKLNGRELELALPLIILSQVLGQIETTLKSLGEIMTEKRKEDLIESKDISLIEFVSQQLDDGKYIQVKEITRLFREFLQTEDADINTKWTGRALKRLNLSKDSRRRSWGNEVSLNVEKAQEKIKMFK